MIQIYNKYSKTVNWNTINKTLKNNYVQANTTTNNK